MGISHFDEEEIAVPRGGSLVPDLVQILRLHRFSRVVHREPCVPSAIYKCPTLYEERDGMCGKRDPSMHEGRHVRGRKQNRCFVIEHVSGDDLRQFWIFKGVNAF